MARKSVRRSAVVLLALLLVAAFALPAAAQFERPGVLASPLHAMMTGEQEAPGPGDPDGMGYGRFLFNQSAGTMCYAMFVQDILLPASAAHIHVAPAGSPGPVVIPLAAPDANGQASGCVSVNPELIATILANPGNYYVNVHNSVHPPGAVRGQLSVPGFWNGGMEPTR